MALGFKHIKYNAKDLSIATNVPPFKHIEMDLPYEVIYKENKKLPLLCLTSFVTAVSEINKINCLSFHKQHIASDGGRMNTLIDHNELFTADTNLAQSIQDTYTEIPLLTVMKDMESDKQPVICTNSNHTFSTMDYRLKHFGGLSIHRAGKVLHKTTNTFQTFASAARIHGDETDAQESALLIRKHLQAEYRLLRKKQEEGTNNTAVVNMMECIKTEWKLLDTLKSKDADLFTKLGLEELSSNAEAIDDCTKVLSLLENRLEKSTVVMLLTDMHMFEVIFGIRLDPTYFYIEDNELKINRVKGKKSSAYLNYVIFDYYEFGWIVGDQELLGNKDFNTWKKK